MSELVGVIGAGSFGTTVAKLISENRPVLIYARSNEAVTEINQHAQYKKVQFNASVRATNDLEELAKQCSLIFPIVPSANFRKLMQDLGPLLRPSHLLIHGTKGLDLVNVDEARLSTMKVEVENIRTMSEVIQEESSVVRVGCLSGPNLASEILEGQPTATVIASEFDELIKIGQNVLASNKFFVFGSHDLQGAQLAGSFKNVIAIASGILEGLKMGRNIQALLITRGLREMVHFGKLMGSTSRAFLGTAGIGDLVATSTSKDSRNYSFGYRLSRGESVDEIIHTMEEVAEGVRTLKIAQQLAANYKLHAPITKTLYDVVYLGMEIPKAINSLMRYPFAPDVDFF